MLSQRLQQHDFSATIKRRRFLQQTHELSITRGGGVDMSFDRPMRSDTIQVSTHGTNCSPRQTHFQAHEETAHWYSYGTLPSYEETKCLKASGITSFPIDSLAAETSRSHRRQYIRLGTTHLSSFIHSSGSRGSLQGNILT